MAYGGTNDETTLKGLTKDVYAKASSKSTKSIFKKLKKLLKDK